MCIIHVFLSARKMASVSKNIGAVVSYWTAQFGVNTYSCWLYLAHAQAYLIQNSRQYFAVSFLFFLSSIRFHPLPLNAVLVALHAAIGRCLCAVAFHLLSLKINLCFFYLICCRCVYLFISLFVSPFAFALLFFAISSYLLLILIIFWFWFLFCICTLNGCENAPFYSALIHN